MNNCIKIPVAMQIRVDDVAWHNGADERFKNRPSRSGFPRKHQPEDYRILSELGKALDTKIACALVLGEWDKDNLLRGVPHVTYDVDGWDMASQIDMDYAQKCLEELESSANLEYTIHGLLHGYYDNGKLITEAQYYPFKYDPENKCYTTERDFLPLDEFKKQIELFYEIYNSWGFKKEIVSFAGPGGCYGSLEENAKYAGVLKEYGILSWSNAWSQLKENTAITNGVICLKGHGARIPWNAYDMDPSKMGLYYFEDDNHPATDFGIHWTNFLRYDSEHNLERLSEWVEFYKKQTEVFGIILSKDTAFAASQAIYNSYAKITFEKNACLIDLSDVDSKNAKGIKNEFYISFKNGYEPNAIDGGSIELYEEKKNFKTYKVVRNGMNLIKISI